MKKVLAVLLSLCLLAGLCSCSNTPIKVKKFSSEEEMKEHLQGVWYDDWSGECFFFDGDRAYLHENINRADSMQDEFDSIVKSQGEDALSKITPKNIVAEAEKEWFTSSNDTSCQLNPKKGTLIYTEDGIEYTLYIGEDTLCGLNGEDEKTKISDTPSYTVPGLIEKFEEAHKNYKPTLGTYRLTASEYAEVLRNQYPSATVTQDGGHVKMGRGFVEVNYGLKPDLLTVSDSKMTTGVEALIADALLVFGNAPDVPSAGELADRFYREGITETETKQIGSYSIVANTKTLVVELDGVEIEMYQWRNYRNSSDGFDMVSVRF